MVKHIVFWKMKEELLASDREEALRKIKQGFEALQGVVPGLLRVEVGIDFIRSAESSDFSSRAALDAYQAHPAHQAMVPLVRAVRIERRVVDYDA